MLKLSLLRAGGFLAGFAVVLAVASLTVVRGSAPADVGPIRSLESSSHPFLAMSEGHECWASVAPADVKVPGHVVVTRDGRAVYGGPRLVRQALEQVFDGVDHDLVVNGFCR